MKRKRRGNKIKYKQNWNMKVSTENSKGKINYCDLNA